MLDYAWLALAIPAASLLYCALLSRGMPRRSYGVVATLATGLAFVVAAGLFASLLMLPPEGRFFQLSLWSWIAAGAANVQVGLLIDPLSVVMALVVTGVGFLIVLYSNGYMAEDPDQPRFYAYMSLFIVAMLTLVLADNFLLLMVGWGGVGLASYLLIAFWFTREEAAAAGVKAFVVNTLGDIGLFLAVFLLFVNFQALDFATVFAAAPKQLPAGGTSVLAITMLLLLAAMAKSAQFPLHVWLPDAMAGPTPVSALIHAATMVTAGVYLIARAHPLFLLSPTTLTVAAVIGAFTALFAATIGPVQTNLKRVLAYSTVSQLGYMFLAVGVGAFTAGIFHLVTHAFFKALLFLAAGGVIHAIGGEEDLRYMRGLRHSLPGVFRAFLIGALANAGIPLFSGFFSKDEVLYNAYHAGSLGPVLAGVGVLTAGLTGFYIFRPVFIAFYGRPETYNRLKGHLHRASGSMMLPLVVLSLLAIFGGYIQVPTAVHAFSTFLEPTFSRYGPAATETTPAATDPIYLGLAGASVGLSLLGILIASRLYAPDFAVSPRFRGIPGLYTLVQRKYYVDELYHLIFVRPLFWLGRFLGTAVEQGVVDAAVNGIGRLVRGFGTVLSTLQTGYVRSYAVAVLAGAVFILGYIVLQGVPR